MPHAVNKRFVGAARIDSDFCLKGQFVEAVLIGKGEVGAVYQLPLEGDVEVDQFSLEHVGHRLRVGDDALHDLLVVGELHAADDGREGVGQKLDDLL